MVPEEYLWIVIVGFILAFLLAFGLGANDVANSFGTSVGSKVLTLKQACILGSVFETLGSVLLGAKVAETIREGIIDVEPYEDEPEQLMLGNLSALAGCSIWLIIATLFRLPVSGTQSIVGATVGFAVVAHGTEGVKWLHLIFIISSWFISPLLSGTTSTAIFFIIKKFILSKEHPLEPGLKLLPFFYGATLVINVFSIVLNGPELFYFDRIPLWGKFVISFGLGLICTVIVRLTLVPWLRRKILGDEADETTDKEASPLVLNPPSVGYSSLDDATRLNTDSEEKKETPPKSSHQADTSAVMDVTDPEKEIAKMNQDHFQSHGKSVLMLQDEEDLQRGREAVKDKPAAVELFSFLQTLTATFASFVHGGNDVSNAIAPLVSLWLIATQGMVVEEAATPVWILLYGGVGISVGLCVLGSRVIQTMGEDLTKVTPSSGFCIEIGAAFTVLLASNLGIPISTTHCIVGGVVFVGRFRSSENVDWTLLRKIFIAWFITMPFAGGVSAGIFAFLRAVT